MSKFGSSSIPEMPASDPMEDSCIIITYKIKLEESRMGNSNQIDGMFW